MKNNRLILYAVVLSSLLLLAACGGNDKGSSSNGDEVFEMEVNNWTPSTHLTVETVFEPWKEYVEEKTEGRIKVELFHGGTLSTIESTYEDIRGGLADVGHVAATYYYDTELFPYSIGNLPFAFPDAKTAATVLTEFGEKYAMDAFEDVHYLGGATSTDPYDLFSNKPIRSIDDVKGLKMRVQGKNDTPIIKSWEGVPVSLPNEDMYESLQKKTIDTTFYTVSGSVGYKLYEVAPYATQMGLNVTPLLPVMNQDFYEQLPDDLKEMMDEDLGPHLSDLFTEHYVNAVDDAIEEIAEELDGKGEVITLSSEEMKEFTKSAEPLWDKWVEEANEKGYPGEEMMEDFLEMREAVGLESPF